MVEMLAGDSRALLPFPERPRCVALMVAFGSMLNYDSLAKQWSLVGSEASVAIEDAWTKADKTFGVLGGVLAAFAGLALGTSGVGAEFKIGTLPFLVTLPRRRRYFIWVSWLTGAAELLGLVVVSVSVAFASLLFFTGSIGNWRLLAIIPLAFTIAVVTYGLTYFMTVLTRSERNGLGTAIVLGITYSVIAASVSHFWKINLPSLPSLLSFFAMGGQSFPSVTMIESLLISVAFPLACQLICERAEV